ncbi:MAG TPA: YjgN family protein [Myxococcota bacterium]
MTAAAPESPPDTGERLGLASVETSLVFTGDGAEYFRIWVVNTLITLLTLGAYSSWAKVRRTRYLWQNTRLGGFAFDYHARPIAILRGRILALGLFGAYTYAFDFSKTAGIVVLAALCVVGPWLFMRAQQFKLANTSWRGLRFGFDGRLPEAFRVVLPILILWFSATVFPVWYADDVPVVLWSQLAVVLPLPWMHHRLKRYQHARASYGDRAFSFAPMLLRFYWVYLKGTLLVVLGGVLGALAIAGSIGVTAALGLAPDAASDPPIVAIVLGTLFAAALVFVFSWPYLAARLQQTTWSATRLGGVRFETRIRAWRLFWLTLQNVFLTVATLGFYWPYAAMRFAKYRIECMTVLGDTPFIAAGTHSGQVGASGEGVADAFGLDLGL